MSKRVAAAIVVFGLAWAPVFAQAPKAEEKKALTEQQKRMQQCNADAKKREFKDNEARQAFMSACLKGAQPMTQQEKMAACNKQASAKALKGDDRKAFMSKCLSG